MACLPADRQEASLSHHPLLMGGIIADQCFRSTSSGLSRIGSMYYYAQGLRQRWTGEKQSCVNPKDSFVLRADDCPKGYKMYPFKEVDAGDSVSLTTKLEE